MHIPIMNDINKLSVAVFVMCMFSIVRQSSAEESARTNKLQQRWPQITEMENSSVVKSAANMKDAWDYS